MTKSTKYGSRWISKHSHRSDNGKNIPQTLRYIWRQWARNKSNINQKYWLNWGN